MVRLSSFAACILLAATASAAPITPTFTTFGSLPAANWGGTGLPNDAVAITTFVVGGDTITLGLTAFERFENPPVTDNGAGVFNAPPGANFGDPTFATMPSAALGATWNYGVYTNIVGPGTISSYQFRLLYDFDPAIGNDQSTHGTLNYTNAVVSLGGGAGKTIQDSQNLNFAFLATTIPGIITPPSSPSMFNPNAIGQYSLALVAYDSTGTTELGRAAILLDTTPVPEPSSMALLGLGGAGLFAMRRRRNSAPVRTVA